MAQRARRVWNLDEIWLLPAFLPPHKNPAGMSDYRHRARMADLLAETEPWLRLCELEKERGGPSYTLDTVLVLKARHASTIQFHLIIGADSLADLASWHEPARLCGELPLLVLAREGFQDPQEFPCAIDRGEMHPAQSRVIRGDIAAGKQASWLSKALSDYIRDEGLYRASAAENGEAENRS